MINVIILDDNHIIIEALESLIDWEQNGFHVLNSFKNGKEALEFISTTQENIDIIFTDMKMPVMDGISFYKEFCKLNILSKTIVLSSYDDFPLVRESFTLGVDDYILKTEFDPDQILKICNQFKVELMEKKYGVTTGSDNKLIAQVLHIIEQKLNQNITLISIAHELDISSGYLGQLFFKYQNKSFSDYLNGKRIEKAKTLLANGNYKIYEISNACGYNNVEHFSRSFKKIVHLSPKEWQSGSVKPEIRKEYHD